MRDDGDTLLLLLRYVVYESAMRRCLCYEESVAYLRELLMPCPVMPFITILRARALTLPMIHITSRHVALSDDVIRPHMKDGARAQYYVKSGYASADSARRER